MPDVPPFVGGGLAGAVAGVVANVVIGDVFPEDNDGKLADGDGDENAIFTDYIIDNKYEEDPHTYMAGITSPNGFQGRTAAFFQLATPTLLFVCRWTASRWNKQPVVPSKEPANQNLVYLYAAPETRNVTAGPDAFTALYRISGAYVYGFKNPDLALLNNVSFGLDPRYADTFTNGRNMPTNLEDPKLMEAQQQQGGNNARLRG